MREAQACRTDAAEPGGMSKIDAGGDALERADSLLRIRYQLNCWMHRSRAASPPRPRRSSRSMQAVTSAQALR
jgi:hypothetical protein